MEDLQIKYEDREVFLSHVKGRYLRLMKIKWKLNLAMMAIGFPFVVPGVLLLQGYVLIPGTQDSFFLYFLINIIGGMVLIWLGAYVYSKIIAPKIHKREDQLENLENRIQGAYFKVSKKDNGKGFIKYVFRNSIEISSLMTIAATFLFPLYYINGMYRIIKRSL